MTKCIKIEDPELVANTTQFQGSVTIGKKTIIDNWSIIGHSNYDQSIFARKNLRVVRIGAGCVIGPWSLIYEGAIIGNNVQVNERCTIGSLTRIGDNCRLHYGAQIHDKVKVGKACIIAGFIADNCKLDDGCSVFGALVHRYEHPGVSNWDITDEPGPILGKKVVIGWGAVIVGPVRIGDRARVTPNSVVRENIEPGEIYDNR